MFMASNPKFISFWYQSEAGGPGPHGFLFKHSLLITEEEGTAVHGESIQVLSWLQLMNINDLTIKKPLGY